MGKLKKLSWSTIIMIAAVAVLLSGCGSSGDSSKQKWDKMPEMSIDLNKQYSAKFATNKGDFTIKLYAAESPVTVNNFVFLARNGYYDGLTFNSIIESFMIQGGDPKGNGTGNPGYSIPDEFDTSIKFEPGVVAMMNSGKPNSGGSQFFICTGPDSVNLNQTPTYSIFGKVDTGMDTVLAIAKTPVNEKHVPKDKVIIDSVTIFET
ncbi:Peptidyl-prolyl cis-trans isomerase (rotamase)-cyclophilin family [Paenibacillus catalpae]|uniref:Peptidyl-prolyl cis-trans isomerase n=1 Tax=Paenibacillus catalpae TaxID=1045775 RepID=A0A1I2FXW7_9BACL|nr:peptidylprolyl isomerase [Paenibacillus catalpae]SFF09356.1 Peptidyl-prolyl cis-trans isomerase (rotamase)-cyclophilin family [Paenibacillus catalpae]